MLYRGSGVGVGVVGLPQPQRSGRSGVGRAVRVEEQRAFDAIRPPGRLMSQSDVQWHALADGALDEELPALGRIERDERDVDEPLPEAQFIRWPFHHLSLAKSR